MSIEYCEGCNMPNCRCPVNDEEHRAFLRNYANGDEYQRSVEWAVGRIADLERQLAELRAQPTWKCFHCDEEFTDAEQAALHFGTTQMQQPVCKIDAAHVRELEAELARYREEDTDLHRQNHGLHAAHHTNLQREEEKGYARGIADARLLPTAQQVEDARDAARWRHVTEILGLRFKPSNERAKQSLEETNATVDAEIAALQAGKEKE